MTCDWVAYAPVKKHCARDYIFWPGNMKIVLVVPRLALSSEGVKAVSVKCDRLRYFPHGTSLTAVLCLHGHLMTPYPQMA